MHHLLDFESLHFHLELPYSGLSLHIAGVAKLWHGQPLCASQSKLGSGQAAQRQIGKAANQADSTGKEEASKSSRPDREHRIGNRKQNNRPGIQGMRVARGGCETNLCHT